MKKGWALLAGIIGAGALILLLVTWFESESLDQIYLNQARRDLELRTRLLAAESRPLLLAGDKNTLNTYCQDTERTRDTRITIVAPSGEVLADSATAPSRMDPHNNRPEVHAAQDGKSAFAIRFSQTLGARMLYFALPVSAGGSSYVFRTAISTAPMDQAIRSGRRTLMASLGVTALAAALAAYLLLLSNARAIRGLQQAAARISAGELTTQLPVPRRGALRDLAFSLSEMAEQLTDRIEDISREKSQRDAVFAALAEGVVLLDPAGMIHSINESARRMLGISGVAGSDFFGLLRQEAVKNFVERLARSNEEGEMELKLPLPGGERELHIRGGLICWSRNRTGVLLVFYDRTQLVRLEHFRRDFVANVSHEIKTPLTVIRAAVETLADGAIEDREAARHFMYEITRHAERLNSLVQDILSLSTLECRAASGDWGAELAPTSLRDIAESAALLAAETAAHHALRIDVLNLRDTELPVDPELMEQALTNLLVNAALHAEGTKSIELEVDTDADNAFFRVIDHGKGIPPEHRARIFERFYRVDRARSRRGGGTGLGLAIVKHIAQLHHGTVELHDTPGGGCTFVLRLPLKGHLR